MGATSSSTVQGGNIQLAPQGSALVNIGGGGLSAAQAIISSSGSTLSNVNLSVVANGTGYVPIVAKGVVSQTADLQQWQEPDGDLLTVVDSAGSIGVLAADPQAEVDVASGTANEHIRLNPGGNSTIDIAASGYYPQLNFISHQSGSAVNIGQI